MDKCEKKKIRRSRRQKNIRKRVIGEPGRPRLSIFRSNHHIYAQVIDDLAGHTLAHASSRESGLGLSSGGNADAAEAVGKTIAERAKSAGIGRVVFDRGGFRYHGRVKALADAARKGGLEF